MKNNIKIKGVKHLLIYIVTICLHFYIPKNVLLALFCLLLFFSLSIFGK